ncbi:MAG: hypothetical protein WAR57_07060 [Candidatus Phosphoribacter sp.]
MGVALPAQRNGGQTRPAGLAEPTPWRLALLTGVIGSVVAWLRMPALVAGDLYAEDGPEFVGRSSDGSAGFLTPYAGYQHLLPRLLSTIISATTPVERWAMAVNAAACLTVGAVAGLVVIYSRDVVGWWATRMALGLAAPMIPIAALEPLGNFANLHWFMLYLMIWALIATPRSALGTWSTALLALLCSLTEIQCALLLPVVVWRCLRSSRSFLPIAVGWLAGVVAQVLTFSLATREMLTVAPPSLASTVEGYILNTSISWLSVRPGVLTWLVENTGLWVGVMLLISVMALASTAATIGHWTARFAILTLLYGSIVSWVTSFVLGRNPVFYYSELNADALAPPPLVRWGTAASIALVATVPISLELLVRKWPRFRSAARTCLLVLITLLATGATFGLPPKDGGWAMRSAEARRFCAPHRQTHVVEVAVPPGVNCLPSGVNCKVRLLCSTFR